MKATFFFKSAMIMVIVLLLNACKGSDGTVGPQGATGATGATGPTGAKGDPGTSITTGTGNVIQVTFTKTFVPPKSGNDQIFTFPTVVTTDILNNSASTIYIETSTFPNTWYAVPGGAISVGGGPADIVRGWVDARARQLGIVRESGINIDQITRTRAVIIPASTSINGRIASIDLTDYEAVKAYYGLKD